MKMDTTLWVSCPLLNLSDYRESTILLTASHTEDRYDFMQCVYYQMLVCNCRSCISKTSALIDACRLALMSLTAILRFKSASSRSVRVRQTNAVSTLLCSEQATCIASVPKCLHVLCMYMYQCIVPRVACNMHTPIYTLQLPTYCKVFRTGNWPGRCAAQLAYRTNCSNLPNHLESVAGQISARTSSPSIRRK